MPFLVMLLLENIQKRRFDILVDSFAKPVVGRNYYGIRATTRIFSYTIESIPVYRKHPKFHVNIPFQVAIVVSILRVPNVGQEHKLTNTTPDSDQDLDPNSETLN